MEDRAPITTECAHEAAIRKKAPTSQFEVLTHPAEGEAA